MSTDKGGSNPQAATPGAYRWISEAVRVLKPFVNAAYWREKTQRAGGAVGEADTLKGLIAETDTLLAGVPCEPQDLGFDSPADRYARAWHALNATDFRRVSTVAKCEAGCPTCGALPTVATGETPETDAHLSHLNLPDGRKVGIPNETVDLLRSLERRLRSAIHVAPKLRAKVEEFRTLKKDWNSYGADPFPAATIERALLVADFLGEEWKVIPCADGPSVWFYLGSEEEIIEVRTDYEVPATDSNHREKA